MTAKFSDLLCSLRYSLNTVEDMIQPEHKEAATMIKQARSILRDAGDLIEDAERLKLVNTPAPVTIEIKETAQ